MNYLLLKYLHVLCVAASFSLFFVRGMWVMRAYPPAHESWVRLLPHAVDGLLLLSAAGMLATAQGAAWPTWMQVKIGLLVVYIVLALVVFRVGKNRFQKGLAWVLGLCMFLFITTVAVLQNPYGVLSLF